MSPEPRSVSEASPKESLGTLTGCLVDDDIEQRSRQRRVKRRALAISILFESAILAALVLVPAFSKAEHIRLTIVTPAPPYSPYKPASRPASDPARRQSTTKNVCRFCVPPRIPPIIVTRDNSVANEPSDPPVDGLVPVMPEGSGIIPLPDTRHGPSQDNIITEARKPRVVKVAQLDPGMLVYRVEPRYPALAMQTHREGRVELRAMIATDGSIESLQIVVSDPLFNQSATEAVEQWRYRPTMLNGQAVRVDTYITVFYKMQH